MNEKDHNRLIPIDLFSPRILNAVENKLRGNIFQKAKDESTSIFQAKKFQNTSFLQSQTSSDNQKENRSTKQNMKIFFLNFGWSFIFAPINIEH